MANPKAGIRASVTEARNRTIENDTGLLDAMMTDMAGKSGVYQPGPFWMNSAVQTAQALRRHGLENFRASRKSTPGATFTDAPQLSLYDYLWYSAPSSILSRVKHVVWRSIFENPLIRSKLFDVLDKTIRRGAEASVYKDFKFYREKYWENSGVFSWFADVQKEYHIPDTLAGGCIDTISVCGQTLSLAYFGTISRILNFHDRVDFRRCNSVFVLGGGFGYEVHMLMSLFPNIKKCITLDIPPNLYIQTQYLKSVLDCRVRDYTETRNDNRIAFSSTDEPEVIAIAPWQIEQVEGSVDLVWNSCSFQEMTFDQVQNYAGFLTRLTAASGEGHICLTMYDAEATTPKRDVIRAFSDCAFEPVEAARRVPVPDPYRELYHLGSPNR